MLYFHSVKEIVGGKDSLASDLFDNPVGWLLTCGWLVSLAVFLAKVREPEVRIVRVSVQSISFGTGSVILHLPAYLSEKRLSRPESPRARDRSGNPFLPARAGKKDWNG
jgi:hypothetical protein